MAPEVQRVRSGLLADWLSAAWKPPLLVIGCLVLSTLILPRWLNYGGSLFGRPLTVEASIRWYLGLTMALGLCVSALIRWPHWSHGMRQTWWALVALLVSFIPIFLFDETRLWDEESWTRYPTTITLIAAGLASLYLVKLRRLSAMPVGETMFWLLLTCCFIFLGADEYLGLHESFGDWLERMPTFAFIDPGLDHVGLSHPWGIVPVRLLGLPTAAHIRGPTPPAKRLYYRRCSFRSLASLRQFG